MIEVISKGISGIVSPKPVYKEIKAIDPEEAKMWEEPKPRNGLSAKLWDAVAIAQLGIKRVLSLTEARENLG